MPIRDKLAATAMHLADTPFHGFTDAGESNLAPIVAHFPGWSLREADALWCAAFVYHCCTEAGILLPARPESCSCSLAGCLAWEQLALAHPQMEYHPRGDGFEPQPGDLVLYDNVFVPTEHDHIGVVLEARTDCIIAAEGNVGRTNTSGIVTRPRDEHIRAFIRLSEGFTYA